MLLSPLDTNQPSLADQAYDAIVAAVLNGAIELGDRIVMDQVAESLGISRTPVRDAFHRLENEGLLLATGRRGFVVREVEDNEVVELYEARKAIEGHAASIVAVADDLAERLQRIQVVVDRGAGGDLSTRGLYLANQAVHRAIVVEANNRHLLASFDGLWGASVALFAYGQLFPVELVDDAIATEHAPLLASIAIGDPDVARLAMIAHIGDGAEQHRR